MSDSYIDMFRPHPGIENALARRWCAGNGILAGV